MSDIAIRIQNLGKLYRIGQRERYYTLRDIVARSFSSLGSPMLRFRRLTTPTPNPIPNNQDLSLETEYPTVNQIWALKEVSFEIRQGEVVGIIGSNGAGKTTLLKILSRITHPTEGYAEIYGRVGSLLEVGTGFHPELTGRENIYLSGAVLGMKRAEIKRKFDEIVSFAEVERFIDTPVKRFSSGMSTRLAFSVAAHLEPEILLVDEVLAVGDAAFQNKCLGKMGDVAHEGRTVLLVSHNMGSIKQLCRQSIWLDRGKVVKMGPTQEIVCSYLEKEMRGAASEHRWSNDEAPGDQTARLKSIRLCSVSGEARSEFGSDEAMYVEVVYILSTKVRSFRIGFALHSSDSTYIFYTSDDDMPAYSGQIREPGEHVSRCQIPGNLLNIGSYYLAISGDIFGVRTVFHSLPRISFTVFSTGGPTSRFNETRRGFLCPDLKWDIRRVGPSSRTIDEGPINADAKGI